MPGAPQLTSLTSGPGQVWSLHGLRWQRRGSLPGLRRFPSCPDGGHPRARPSSPTPSYPSPRGLCWAPELPVPAPSPMAWDPPARKSVRRWQWAMACQRCSLCAGGGFPGALHRVWVWPAAGTGRVNSAQGPGGVRSREDSRPGVWCGTETPQGTLSSSSSFLPFPHEPDLRTMDLDKRPKPPAQLVAPGQHRVSPPPCALVTTARPPGL